MEMLEFATIIQVLTVAYAMKAIRESTVNKVRISNRLLLP